MIRFYDKKCDKQCKEKMLLICGFLRGGFDLNSFLNQNRRKSCKSSYSLNLLFWLRDLTKASTFYQSMCWVLDFDLIFPSLIAKMCFNLITIKETYISQTYPQCLLEIYYSGNILTLLSPAICVQVSTFRKC